VAVTVNVTLYAFAAVALCSNIIAARQWCTAKNGGGYTQRGVAKSLKVPCLFMITEVSTRCQKNPEVGIRRIPAYTPQYTTAARRSMPVGVDRYLPAGHPAANLPQANAAVNQWDRQTDKRPLHKLCSASMQTVSITSLSRKNSVLEMTGK